MSEFTITKLNRENLPLKIYIQGLSGSGKTFGALTLARGISPTGKIGIIDTLGGQANQYGGYDQFGDVACIQMEGPFTADRCIAAIEAAMADKWEVIIFDTLSNHHDGDGGLLERADEEADKGAKGMGKWNKPKMETRRLMSFIRDSRVHLIGTYIMAETTDMDTKVSKVSPIRTKGSETYYTFHVEVVNLIDNQGEYHPAKWLRLPQDFQSCVKQGQEITLETGRLLAGQSGNGSTTTKSQEPESEPLRDMHLADIGTFLDSEGMDVGDFNAAIESAYKDKKVEYRDYEKLPDDHLAILATSEALRKMADLAIKLKEGGKV